MRVSQLPSFGDSHVTNTPAAIIGVGLAILIASVWWTNAPVVTAMAAISLGATQTTISRFRGSEAVLPILLLHGSTYALLYSLFVIAKLHTAGLSATTSVDALAMLDLAASTVPMAIALRRISTCLRQLILSRP